MVGNSSVNRRQQIIQYEVTLNRGVARLGGFSDPASEIRGFQCTPHQKSGGFSAPRIRNRTKPKFCRLSMLIKNVKHTSLLSFHSHDLLCQFNFNTCVTLHRLPASYFQGPSTKDVPQNIGFSNHPPPWTSVSGFSNYFFYTLFFAIEELLYYQFTINKFK